MIESSLYWLYLAVVVVSTYLIRALPFGLAQKKIGNRWISSFLYYIPYAVLCAMTIPAVFYATPSVWSAVSGVLVAVLLAIKVRNLTLVAFSSCLMALLTELFLRAVGV